MFYRFCCGSFVCGVLARSSQFFRWVGPPRLLGGAVGCWVVEMGGRCGGLSVVPPKLPTGVFVALLGAFVMLFGALIERVCVVAVLCSAFVALCCVVVALLGAFVLLLGAFVLLLGAFVLRVCAFVLLLAAFVVLSGAFVAALRLGALPSPRLVAEGAARARLFDLADAFDVVAGALVLL